MSFPVSRRRVLETLGIAAAGVALGPPIGSHAEPTAPWTDPTVRFLESLARPDQGYAWPDQEQSHLTPTFAVIGCYRALNGLPPSKAALGDFVRTHHPARLKKLEQERRMFEFQQVQALVWLGEQVPDELRDKITAWTEPLPYMKQYEQHGYPVFQSELGAIACRELLGLPLEDLRAKFVPYVDSRRRKNGSFNNTPTADGGDGHVMNTWWGLHALDVFGRVSENSEATIEWLRRCQLPNGGFTYQPDAPFAGVDDAAYTWAAVRSLRLLGATPRDKDGCVRYLHSLLNGDGGFSDRPGWLSNPMATYYALDSLATLEALDVSPGPRTRAPRSRPRLPSNLKVFTIQIEAHGHGSPAEVVDLARALRIDLWGAKNARPEWVARAQAIAERDRVPVKFFVSDEEYGTWVNVPGLGTYSHTSDIVAPAGSEFGAPLSKAGVVSWPEFRDRRLQPLTKAGGRLIWQFGENEELVRLYLDDSVERGGYAAISTFHFGNPDFTNSEPFLNRWRGRIPYVALQDSHGNEPWWFADMTTGFRTLFLATEPTWAAWLEALEQNRVAAVRHDAASANKTWIHTGSREVLEFIRARESDWRWWDNPRIQRPLVSMVAVRPQDEFETARPQNGVTLRVRCAWHNTPQGLLKEPMTELVKLTVDNRAVDAKLVATKAPRGALLADHYHHVEVVEPGQHTATALVRVIDTKEDVKRQIQFVV